MARQSEYWDSLSDRPLDASVIDPNDKLGEKNRYLAGVRDRLVMDALDHLPASAAVLDLGCGTGSLTQALASRGHSVLGLDISMGLLRRTHERRYSSPVAFVCFDGAAVPLPDMSIDAITTYVVLTHVMEDTDLSRLLRECHRVLKPGGTMVCIEQCRRRQRVDERGWKHFRTRRQWIRAFEGSGFAVRAAETVRFGRFPSTPFVRAGVVPRSLYGTLSRVEQLVGRMVTVLPGDYCDTRFVLSKSVA